MKVNLLGRQLKKSALRNEGGFAMFEGLVFLMAFVVLTVYVIDSFTAIHTGIVNSIGARSYLFETLEHRANIRYLRFNFEGAAGAPQDFAPDHQRLHAVNDEDQDAEDRSAPKAVGRTLTQAVDGRRFNNPNQLNGNNQTNVIYVKEGYGICIDAGCPGG